MAFSVKELRTAFHPVFCIDANHQPRLAIEGGVLAVHSSLKSKIAAGLHMKKVAIIGDVAVVGFAPEVCLRTRMHDQLFSDSLRSSRLVEPGHASDQVSIDGIRESR